MSNKTNFKRIALAVVAALGFGVLASGPSNAAVQAGSTLSLSASSASVTAGETATVTLTAVFTPISTNDTMVITAVRTAGSAAGVGTPRFEASVIDTLAVRAYGTTGGTEATIEGVAGNLVQGKVRFHVMAPSAAGTYAYTFYASWLPTSNTAATPAPVTFTVTVAAKDTKPSAAFSKVGMTAPGSTILFTADSSIVAPRTTTDGVGVIGFRQRNSSDTNVVTGTEVYESVTAAVSGPGFISLNGGATKVRALTTVVPSDTIVVWADGTAGTGTITFTTSTLSTWTSKSVTFAGALATASLTAAKTTTAVGNSDTQTVIRAVLRDSAQNLFTASQEMFVHSSDTKVVANAACTVAVNPSLGYGNCALSLVDSGTAKIKIANFAFGTAAASLPTVQVISDEVTITVAGSAARVAISFDKRTYNPGEKAIITVAVTDGLGRAVADQTIASLFATGGITVSPSLSQGTVSAETVTVSAASFGVGRFQYTVNMPNNAAEVVASATGGTGLVVAANRVVVSDTVTVVNPATDAANAALDAAQEATDAAIAATDAAIAAQEAADEAASAAIAAQETAQAAVDAVTALSAEVTKLVAQIATLQKLLNRVAKRVGVNR